jgi:SAM-dependent methyltransferase
MGSGDRPALRHPRKRNVRARGAPADGRLPRQTRGRRAGARIRDRHCPCCGALFTLVYLVYNTISNLPTQSEQMACFRNAARHLTAGGRFVIELWVPELRKLPPGQQATVWHCEPGYISLDTYDVLHQRIVSHHFTSV